MKTLTESYVEFASQIAGHDGGAQIPMLCNSYSAFLAGAACMAQQFAQGERSAAILEDIRDQLIFLTDNLKKELERSQS